MYWNVLQSRDRNSPIRECRRNENGKVLRVYRNGHQTALSLIASWKYKTDHIYRFYGKVTPNEEKRIPIQLPERFSNLNVTGNILIFDLVHIGTRKSRNLSTYLHQKIFRFLEGENRPFRDGRYSISRNNCRMIKYIGFISNPITGTTNYESC
jgi:hypothetical protein